MKLYVDLTKYHIVNKIFNNIKTAFRFKRNKYNNREQTLCKYSKNAKITNENK